MQLIIENKIMKNQENQQLEICFCGKNIQGAACDQSCNVEKGEE